MASTRRLAVLVQVLRGMEVPTQFVLSVVAAGLLSPTEFGLAGVVISVQSIVVVFAAFGYEELGQRTISEGARDRDDVVRAGLASRILVSSAVVAIGMCTYVVAVIYPAVLSPSTGLLIAVSSVWSATLLLGNFTLAASISLRSPGLPLIASLLSWALPIAIIYYASSSSGALGYLTALALGGVLRVFLSLVWLARRRVITVPTLSRFTRRPRFRGLLLDTTGAHGAVMVYNLNNQVLARHGDVIVAGLLGVSLASIGSYGLAFQVAFTVNSFLMLGIGAVGLSDFSSVANDPERLRVRWRLYSYVAGWLAVGPIVVLGLVSWEIGQVLLHDRYPQFPELLIALCVVQWISRVSGGGTNIAALIATGDTRYVGRNSMLGAFLNIALNLALVPLIGIFGLAVGTGLALLTVGGGNQLRLHRTLGTRLPAKFFGVATLGVFGCLTLAATAPNSGPLRWSVAGVVTVAWMVGLARTLRRSA